MKTKFIKLYSFLLLFTAFSISAQVNTNSNTVSALADSNLFLDATNFEGLANGSFGRGLGFPRTNLTTFVFNNQAIDDLQILSDFDGMVVFNSATGNTGNNAATQGQIVPVSPGFYYFSNPGNPGNVTNGRWLPVGGSAATVAIANGTAVNNNVTVNGTAERVVRLTGIAADGVNTTLNLSAALTTAGVTVGKFRKASIYNASGDLVMEATGSYNAGVLVTGNGFMNNLLPAANYSVELYYTL
jgi:hypothetical protein